MALPKAISQPFSILEIEKGCFRYRI